MKIHDEVEIKKQHFKTYSTHYAHLFTWENRRKIMCKNRRKKKKIK